jgi:hypothetical protein
MSKMGDHFIEVFREDEENQVPISTRLCNSIIYVGDYVKVRYTTGKEMKNGILTGIVTKVWPTQAQVNNGWCFHTNDELLEHTRENDI